MLDEGADIIDVGRESTRPGARVDAGETKTSEQKRNSPPSARVATPTVSAEDELKRVIPVIAELKKKRPSAVISVDTYKASVARAAVSAGAEIVNDVSGFRWDALMTKTVVELKCGCVLMHMRGRPEEWRTLPPPGDVVLMVKRELKEWAEKAVLAGVRRERIVLDPAFGFGKSFDQNYPLMARFGELQSAGFPLLAGTSRKSFIGRTLAQGEKTPLRRTAFRHTRVSNRAYPQRSACDSNARCEGIGGCRAHCGRDSASILIGCSRSFTVKKKFGADFHFVRVPSIHNLPDFNFPHSFLTQSSMHKWRLILAAATNSAMDDLNRISNDPRVTVRRSGPPDPQGTCVVYWMQRAQRGIDNPALDVAIDAANVLGKPVVVFFAPVPFYPHANLRHYSFLNEGIPDIAAALEKRNVGFVLRRFPDHSLIQFCEEVKAALVVGDENPMREPLGWRKTAAKKLKVPLWTVDAAASFPQSRWKRINAV